MTCEQFRHRFSKTNPLEVSFQARREMVDHARQCDDCCALVLFFREGYDTLPEEIKEEVEELIQKDKVRIKAEKN